MLQRDWFKRGRKRQFDNTTVLRLLVYKKTKEPLRASPKGPFHRATAHPAPRRNPPGNAHAIRTSTGRPARLIQRSSFVPSLLAFVYKHKLSATTPTRQFHWNVACSTAPVERGATFDDRPRRLGSEPTRRAAVGKRESVQIRTTSSEDANKPISALVQVKLVLDLQLFGVRGVWIFFFWSSASRGYTRNTYRTSGET